jgi:hypothetical protein
MFIARSVILFFVSVLQKVLLLRLGLFSILYLIFFEEKLSNNAILFIYFRGFRKIISFKMGIKIYTKLF